MKIDTVPIGDLRPYGRNPRRNDRAAHAVAHSIRRFGIRQPIVATPDGTIVAGHTTYRAAQQLGLQHVPVHYADLTPAQARAYRIADNRTHEAARWDRDKLDAELLALEAIDMTALGFDAPQAEPETDAEDPEDAAPRQADSQAACVILKCIFTAEQHATVARALAKAEAAGPYAGERPNKAAAGLTRLCEHYRHAD